MGPAKADAVGDLVWTIGDISETGGNNVNDLVNEIGLGEGTSMTIRLMTLIILNAPEDQSGVPAKVGSDDSVKVWLNGEVVHTNAVNRGAGDFQDDFKVNLMAGPNVLLVKVSERGGGGVCLPVSAARGPSDRVSFPSNLPENSSQRGEA